MTWLLDGQGSFSGTTLLCNGCRAQVAGGTGATEGWQERLLLPEGRLDHRCPACAARPFARTMEAGSEYAKAPKQYRKRRRKR